MKYFILLTLLLVEVAYTQLALPDFDKEQVKCVTELSLDASKIRKLSEVEGEINRDEKCVLRCVLQRTGAIDKNGVPIEDEVDKQFAKNKNIDISKCTPPSTITDPCEQTYVLTVCVLNLLKSV